jgi:hypothetical protein
MLFARRHQPLADFLRRLFAAGSVGLVLLLAVLASSPAAHEWIHGHAEAASQTPDSDDDGCVVNLFAHGVLSATIFAALLFVSFCLVAGTARPREAVRLATPRYRLPPLCGPPQDRERV